MAITSDACRRRPSDRAAVFVVVFDLAVPAHQILAVSTPAEAPPTLVDRLRTERAGNIGMGVIAGVTELGAPPAPGIAKTHYPRLAFGG